MTMTAKWKLEQLIADLGGPTRVRELLLAQNMKVPNFPTIYTWSKELRAPAHAVALMVALARRLDPNFDVYAYLETSGGE